MELAEALHLVADFLRSQKLTRTYKTLIEEAGLYSETPLDPNETKGQLEFWLKSGDWP